MRVAFHGAAKTVTGSCTLLEAGGTRILVDCGQFQGDDSLEWHNRAEAFGFDPASIDALVLTHAHVDHIGRSPLLVTRGFRGQVLCTSATAAITQVMLADSVRIQEEDARRGGPPPGYGEREVKSLLSRVQRLRYGQARSLGEGITVTLSDAGHILGSAHVLATLTEGGRRVDFGVSGDVGSPGRPVVADPTPFRALDCLQVECTYGDRDHKSGEASLAELLHLLEQTERDGGVTLVPAFALGRTQDLLFHINRWKGEGRLARLKVFVDSPLATRLTNVFQGQRDAFDDDMKGLLARGDDPFDFPGLTYVGNPDESERVTREAHGAAIIASSGMCQGGRIVRHLEALLPRPSTRVVFVGYQAPGTLGRRLVDRAESVRIHGRPVAVNASVHTLGGFSAHAGRRELLDWIRAAARRPSRVFLCHGEPPALTSFAQALRDELGITAHIPHLGESIALT